MGNRFHENIFQVIAFCNDESDRGEGARINHLRLISEYHGLVLEV